MMKVDSSKCGGCGKCIEVCPSEAVTLVDGKAVVNDQCIDCEACVSVCETQAISSAA